MKMSLQDYIDKYGEESGTKRYNGVQKLIESRKKTYQSQPYVRFTKEWFIWRYPEDGLARFNAHVDKSRQSEENMIKRWGEELGKKKWQETLSKKNTRKLVQETKGDQALYELDQKRNNGIRKYWNELTSEERERMIQIRKTKSSNTKKIRYGDKSKLQIYIDKYGEEDGPIKYAEYLQNIFKSIGSSREASSLIKSIIREQPWLEKYTLYYRDLDDLNKIEWFLSNKNGVWFYDFCVREAKAILEYNGSRWHPTAEQVQNFGDELMVITGISYKEQYERDLLKIKVAEDRGFRVFVIRSDFEEQEKSDIIRAFIEYVKEVVG